MLKKMILTVVFLWTLAAGACAGPIIGQVVESVAANEAFSSVQSQHKLNRPIDGAQVVVEGYDVDTYTNATGWFQFKDFPDGVYNIAVVKEGYHVMTKQVKVEGLTPSQIHFVLVKKKGSSSLNLGAPSQVMAPNSVYVAFSAISMPGSSSASKTGAPVPGSNMSTLQYRSAIAAGADPNSLGGMPAPPQVDVGRGVTSSDFATPAGAMPNNITVLDPHTPKNTSAVNFNAKPYWVCFDNSGTRVFVSTESQYITVLDAASGNRVIGSIPANGVVTDMKRAPDGNVYVSIIGKNPGVMVISPTTNTTMAFYPVTSPRIPDAQPRALAVGTNYIYVAMGANSSGEVLALNRSGGAVLGACAVGAFPNGVCLTPNGKYLFVSNRNSGDVSIVDAASLSPLGKVRVGSQPMRIVSSPTGDRIYVANYGSNYVSVIDGRNGSVVSTVNTGKGPLDVGITSDGTRLFVSNNIENSITVIDTEINAPIQTTVSSTVSKPFGLSVRPGGGR